MRLAISGTAAQGKTTLLNEFLKNWTMYTTPELSYRSVLNKDKHSKHTDKETQWAILNHMIDQMENLSSDDHVILDRCPLDNLVYSLWAYHKGVGDIDELFIGVPGLRTVAVADDTDVGVGDAITRHRLTQTASGFLNWRKMLADVKPDVVAICSRNIQQHAEMAIA